MEYKAIFFKYKDLIFLSILDKDNKVTKPISIEYPEMFYGQIDNPETLEATQLSMGFIKLFDGTKPVSYSNICNDLENLFFEYEEYNRLDLFEHDADESLTYIDAEDVDDNKPKLLAVSLVPDGIYDEIFGQLLLNDLYFLSKG